MTENRNQKSKNKKRKKRSARFCLLIPAFCLLGCGFSPIYGPHDNNEPVTKALSSVSIANIPNRDGQLLRNHLIDRMYSSGRPEHPDAVLSVSLHNTETDLGIQKDATTALRELNLWANYKLRDNNGKEIVKGTAHSVVIFSKLDAQYGTLSAERNALDRAIREVGEQIVNRLNLYYAEKS